jgi:putative hydrolase of the HAD superfamily
VALVTLDALGTLVELLPPAPALVAELRARGVEVSERQAAAALAEEIAYYRAHHDTASDAASLALLRARCGAVLGEALARAGACVDLPAAQLLDALLAALRFRAYPEVAGALRALRDAGHRLVVVSNWDVSLHDALRSTGLAPLLHGAISSAEAGSAKPDPRIFARALELAGGGDAQAALHAGDSLEHDVAGAWAAGLRPVLVARDGRPGAGAGVPEGVAVIGSLTELAKLAEEGP